MIKVVVCDGKGTLELPRPSDQVKDLLSSLTQWGMQLAVASNDNRQSIVNLFQAAHLPVPKIIVTQYDVGERKPSKELIYKIQQLAQVKRNEMVYLGDSDKTDIFCAINTGVLPIAAKYSKDKTPLDYGIPAPAPKAVKDFLYTYGRQNEPYFGWRFGGNCADTHSAVELFALIGDHGSLGLTEPLKKILKKEEDTQIGSPKLSFENLIFYYFVSQCYLSGLINDIDWVTVYPGHGKGSVNPVLARFSDVIAVTFKKFQRNLIIRHTTAQKSHAQQENRNIFEQFRTISLNPQYQAKIKGKTILVLDDFTTYGYSLETARRMLLMAGAKRVICVAIAKFKHFHTVTRITKSWDPFVPCALVSDDIRTDELNGKMNISTDNYFKDQIFDYYNR